jgi:hypothetical protein
MFDWVYCELIIWQTYGDRLRQVEKDRLVRQARPGQKRRFRFPRGRDPRWSAGGRPREWNGRPSLAARARKPQQVPDLRQSDSALCHGFFRAGVGAVPV